MSSELSIVIVSWNSRELLASCLESVHACTGREPPEIVVVDNHSADRTPEMLCERFPDVRVIVNDSNLGFAVAANIGIRASSGRYVLLLNPDTELTDPSTLERMVRVMDADAGVGAAGCALVGDGDQPLVSAGFEPAPATLLAFSLFLTAISRGAIRGLSLDPAGTRAPECMPVAWVSGACMIVRREVAEQVGLFDESYFLYGEDIEWGCRISRNGWTVLHMPRLRVYHRHRGTQADRDRPATRWIDGLAKAYMDLERGRSWYFFKVCLGTGFGLRAAILGAVALLTGDTARARRAEERAVWFRHVIAMCRPQSR